MEAPIEGHISTPPPMWRVCPKGHRIQISGTDNAMFYAPFTMTASGGEQPYHSRPICPYCYVQWIEATFPFGDTNDPTA